MLDVARDLTRNLMTSGVTAANATAVTDFVAGMARWVGEVLGFVDTPYVLRMVAILYSIMSALTSTPAEVTPGAADAAISTLGSLVDISVSSSAPLASSSVVATIVTSLSHLISAGKLRSSLHGLTSTRLRWFVCDTGVLSGSTDSSSKVDDVLAGLASLLTIEMVPGENPVTVATPNLFMAAQVSNALSSLS